MGLDHLDYQVDYKSVILIDAYNLGRIVFHGMGELSSQGRQTGVIYGFLRQILKISELFYTCHFVFCWDSKQSIRKIHYPEYKQHRRKDQTVSDIRDRQALHEQLEALRTTWLFKLGFCNNLRYTGLEADDVIAIVIKNAVTPPVWRYYMIASMDKDLYQLLAADVVMLNLRTKEQFTEHAFTDKYRIPVSDWIYAKSLGGCDSDNIKGIKGIADPAKSKNSRALQYLRGELTGKYKELIESDYGQSIFEKNLPLVTLPIKNDIKPYLGIDAFSRDKFIDVFDELGFYSFLNKDTLNKWEKYFIEEWYWD